MNTRKRRRLAFVAALLVGTAGAAALAITALQDNVLYFYGPSDVVAKHIAPGTPFRLGGLVEKHSIVKQDATTIAFAITDGSRSIPVEYTGELPALFREGQGVVAVGRLAPSGTFVADQILAKHDEKYMPPEVVDALKRSGHWQH